MVLPIGQPTGTYTPSEPESSASAPSSDVRFPPGTLVAGRYRIVALLGKGGMGEVYRADDLKLAQSVALKFLPAALVSRPDRLERLHSEVRVARQVSHPNVCRVYDIGEADGQTFLTMEFIDGQDLAGLLRQAGRLPEDRGIELARQLCLGLAAAHDRGVIHRDLKPQNVMIDGRGQVRITDFGLAVLAGTAADVSSGTPAYMAPEQLAGKEVTPQSDLYALGLILHEIFTGKRVFEARTPEELRKLHADSSTSKPSSHLSGLNPAIERAIVRCLERDPKGRPRSAYEVLVALPGGDPLTAALAAGETPSPEMVADATLGADFSPPAAVALVVAILICLAVMPFLSQQTLLVNRLQMQDSSEVLRHKARTILRQFDIDETNVADSTYGFELEENAHAHWARTPGGLDFDFLSSGQPAVLYFWYRQSPRHLVQRENPTNPFFVRDEPGLVTPTRPAPTVPGMTTICLDIRGRLIELIVVPPDRKPAPTNETPMPWKTAFDAAGLKMEAFKPVEPRRRPPVYAEESHAWIGVFPDQPHIPLRVEAARCFGAIVYFHMAPDAQADAAPRGVEETAVPPFSRISLSVVMAAILSLGGWLAWRNIHSGKANLTGARRLALVYFCASMLAWLIMAHHSWSFFEELWGLAAPMIGRSAVFAGLLWVVYVALEPYARQRWPWRMVGWNRLLAGRWRDPLIGHDVLVGIAATTLLRVFFLILLHLPKWFGWREFFPFPLVDLDARVPAVVFLVMLVPVMVYFFLIWLIGMAARKDWLTGLIFVAFMVFGWWMSIPADWHAGTIFLLIFWVLMAIVIVFTLFRYGLLAFTALWLFGSIYLALPLTSNWSAWYASVGVGYLLAIAAASIAACVIAINGRPLFEQKSTDGTPM